MTRIFPVGFLAALLPSILACTAAGAHEYKAGDLVIDHPWARATPKGAKVGGGYVVITNKGTVPDHLTGGSLAVAGKTALHQMSMEGGVMHMRESGPLEIPAGGELKLDPASTHIMFTGLTRGLNQGEMIDGTLTFEHAGTVPVRFAVEGLAAKQPAAGGHDMHGMDKK